MNRKRRCCLCKTYQDRGTMVVAPAGAFCSYDHATQYGRAKVAKAKARAEREQKREFRLRDKPHQFQLTLKAARQLANLLDKDLPCICCDAPRGTAQFCGGHYKTAGGHPELAIDIRNIHGQRNKTCNQEKSGNIHGDKHSHGFRNGLLMRYGPELVEWLESYHPPRKYTSEELAEIRRQYNTEIKRIESGQPPSRDWRSLSKTQERSE